MALHFRHSFDSVAVGEVKIYAGASLSFDVSIIKNYLMYSGKNILSIQDLVRGVVMNDGWY